mgnify:CR=1 FL=1
MFLSVTTVASHRLFELASKHALNPAGSERQPSFRKLRQIEVGLEMK